MEQLDERVFEATTETIRAARLFVRQRGEAAIIESRALADIELATSELASNAIEHGSGGEYRVRLAISSDRFVVEVASTRNGTTPDTPDEWTIADPVAPSGRGLGIVKALSANAWTEYTDDLMIIGCEFYLSNTNEMPLL